jgi:hypothetical protein
MSAVHGPMPCSAVNAACASSASIAATAARSMCFREIALPISLMALIFGRDRPSRASLSERASRTVSWWNGSNAANSRARIAAALAVESCWPQTIEQRPA